MIEQHVFRPSIELPIKPLPCLSTVTDPLWCIQLETLRKANKPKVPAVGPHVCRGPYGPQCCIGWERSKSSGMCITPVCRGSCGEGTCTAPNRCTTCTTTATGISCTSSVPRYTGALQEGRTGNSQTRTATEEWRVIYEDSKKVTPDRASSHRPANQPSASSYYNSCSSLRCQYRCERVSGLPRCTCPKGYQVRPDLRTCQDIDECLQAGLCNHFCSNKEGSFECTCRQGYVLQSNLKTCLPIQRPVNPVNSRKPGTAAQSGLYGSATRYVPNGYATSTRGISPLYRTYTRCSTCNPIRSCPPGTVLRSTSNGVQCIVFLDVDECGSSNCEHDCVNAEGGYKCECRPGFVLSADKQKCVDEDECSRSDFPLCHHICTNTIGSYRCYCRPGFYLHPNGKSCIDVDECLNTNGLSQPACHHSCRNTHGSFQCLCRVGFTLMEDGSTCADVNECEQANRCSGRCINTIGSYTCSCGQGYANQGSRCVDINECATPGKGGCAGTCINTEGSYFCSCGYGFQLGQDGRSCQDVNECSAYGQQVCEKGCKNMDGSFHCVCPDGYRLHSNKRNCVDIDECREIPGLCHYQCQNNRGSYVCVCPAGMRLAADGKMCSDIDECEGLHECEGDCQNTIGSYQCTCEGGFVTGSRTRCQRTKHCTPDTCDHHCVDTANGFNCLCRSGYQLDPGGRNCRDIDECHAVTNGGCQHECRNTLGSFYCTCLPNYRLYYDRRRCIPLSSCRNCNQQQCSTGFSKDASGRCVDGSHSCK
ncbi:latent-transforming growth factor beta-binding protein 2-like [Anneissia japonica]|uniref:latent-transforming growth factor beta-binding protein 2-like n=1 Tax=Anneissia japonica TaxID=1529436 RepID=UPI0014255922|nr:latent-transforming growth factor beta-binding protein 2-like [Anneissia japonica]